MEHTVEKLSSNKVKITFNVPAADFEEAVQKAYLKARGNINVPGFRKGKAPRKLIESMYGSEVFFEDALEGLFPAVYTEAINANDLRPVGRPDVDVQEMKMGQDLKFTCEVFVFPEIKLGEYKGVAVTRKLRKVTEEEALHTIEAEQKRIARSVDVTDRALENGDTAALDYSGSVDGEKFDGGTAEGQTLVIGSNSFIPGFEEQMIGMNIGEERDLNVKFPDEYHAENLKGKDAVFHVKLNGVTREELPELDDDFASEVSDFDNFADYKADVIKKLQETADAKADEEAKQSLVDAVVAAAEIDVPEPMVDEKLDEMMQQMAWRMQQQGFSMEQYLSIIGQTEAQMREMYRGEALKNVRSELVINEILKQEKVEADDADVDKMLESYASAMSQTIDQLKETFNPEQMEYFKHRACVTKVFDMLWDNAKVTDVDADAVKDEPKADEETSEKE